MTRMVDAIGAPETAGPDLSGFVRLGPCADVPDGRGKAYVAQGRKVAVFRDGDRYFALANQCPHKRGPLADGYVEGKVVTCPWHGWEIDLESGAVLHDATLSAPCFALRVENGELLVKVADASAPA